MWKKSIISIISIAIIILIIILAPKENSIIKGQYKRDFYGYLEIDKINLKLGFYEIDDIRNNVEYNIEVVKDEEGSLFIAGHSGVGKKAFFNDLSLLEINDDIRVLKNNKTYNYKVVKTYLEKKDGTITVKKDSNENILVLTTCSQSKKGYQLVIKANLGY